MILIILSILRLTKILLLYKNIRKFLKDKGIICIVKNKKMETSDDARRN